MKLVTWNAAMRFRDKIEEIFPFEADILVIPECEAPERWGTNKNLNVINEFLWFGDIHYKGLGVMTLNNAFQIKLHPSYNKDFRYIVPIIVSGEEEFILFAVWSQNTKRQYESYTGQIYLALKYYESLLKEPCIIVGDWNSNKIFDYIKRVGTHSEVVELLKNKGIESAYHHYFKEEQGKETRPTHYFRKDKSSPFHIDCLFASESILYRLSHFEVGSYDSWIKYSDHTPLSAVFEKRR
jgi:exonuclease III